jgi:hypothetical protein
MQSPKPVCISQASPSVLTQKKYSADQIRSVKDIAAFEQKVRDMMAAERLRRRRKGHKLQEQAKLGYEEEY